MAIFFMDSIAHYTTVAQGESKWASLVSAPTAGAGAFGAPALVEQNDNRIAFPAVTTLELSGYLHLTSTNEFGTLLRFWNGDGVQCEISVSGIDGSFRLYRGLRVATLHTSDAAAIGFNEHHHIYVKIVMSATVGVCVIKVDGVEVVNQTGLNLAGSAGDVEITTVAFYGDGQSNIAKTKWSHIALASASGDITGRPRIQALFPDGAGNYSQWNLTGAATYHEAVDETTPDDDTTYASESVVGDKVSATYSNALSSTATILAVAVVPRAKTDDGASRNIKTFVRSGGADYEHAGTKAVPGSYSYLQQIYEDNPATTNPWTPAEVNAIEAGVKVEA